MTFSEVTWAKEWICYLINDWMHWLDIVWKSRGVWFKHIHLTDREYMLYRLNILHTSPLSVVNFLLYIFHISLSCPSDEFTHGKLGYWFNDWDLEIDLGFVPNTSKEIVFFDVKNYGKKLTLIMVVMKQDNCFIIILLLQLKCRLFVMFIRHLCLIVFVSK